MLDRTRPITERKVVSELGDDDLGDQDMNRLFQRGTVMRWRREGPRDYGDQGRRSTC